MSGTKGLTVDLTRVQRAGRLSCFVCSGAAEDQLVFIS
jgi:hypothetical protein